MKLIEARTQKAALVAQIRSLKDANPVMNDAVQSEIDALFVKVDAISAEIASEERLAGHEAELRISAGSVPRDPIAGPAVHIRSAGKSELRAEALKRTNSDEYKAALADYALRGESGMSLESRSLLNTETRALAEGTGSTGGFTVPTGFVDQIVIAQKSYGEFLTVCDYLNTDSGNPIQYPLVNDSANSGEVSAEAGSIATNQDPAFGQVTLTPEKWDSGIVKISLELLEDSAFSIDTLLQKFFAIRMARKLNNLVTVGSTTGNIQGLIGAATSDSAAMPVGATTGTGATSTIGYTDLTNLFFSVDAAYRNQGVWQMSSATMNILTQLEDTLHRPLINTNIAAGLTNTLLGRPIVFNEDLPTPAAGTKSIVFGDPKSYLIRSVGTPRIIRLNELYAQNGQVGFLMVGRAAGRILDAGTHPLKALQQAAS